jgi:hypothetical protein
VFALAVVITGFGRGNFDCEPGSYDLSYQVYLGKLLTRCSTLGNAKHGKRFSIFLRRQRGGGM